VCSCSLSLLLPALMRTTVSTLACVKHKGGTETSTQHRGFSAATAGGAQCKVHPARCVPVPSAACSCRVTNPRPSGPGAAQRESRLSPPRWRLFR
jgi:hypothetical protein